MYEVGQAMKERPILFSGEMVRAILEGRKAQTRRVVKPFSVEDEHRAINPHLDVVRCPYGQPGDRLWVREAFQPLFAEGVKFRDADWQTGKGYAIRYVATDSRTEWMDPDDNITDRCKPGIHMPRWASRLTLELTEVRVERVQDITNGNAKSEGVQGMCFGGMTKLESFIWSYKTLWDQINAKRDGGIYAWEKNPWVWVLGFGRVRA